MHVNIAAMKKNSTLKVSASKPHSKSHSKPRSLDAVPLSLSSTKLLRSDGVEARQRLLSCALCLFAEKGYARTSTREIASAAQVNISAISYYFGDKANLYRTVFNDPRTNPNVDPSQFEREGLTLREGIDILMSSFVESFKQGEMAQHCLKLHLREMLEPTGLWMEEIDKQIRPAHQAFVKFLARQCGAVRVDDDLHRLAFAISGLALTMMVSSDVIFAVRPSLIRDEKAIDRFAERLCDYATCMCEQERSRRLT